MFQVRDASSQQEMCNKGVILTCKEGFGKDGWEERICVRLGQIELVEADV